MLIVLEAQGITGGHPIIARRVRFYKETEYMEYGQGKIRLSRPIVCSPPYDIWTVIIRSKEDGSIYTAQDAWADITPGVPYPALTKRSIKNCSWFDQHGRPVDTEKLIKGLDD